MQPELLADWMKANELCIKDFHGKGSCLLAAMLHVDASQDAGIKSLRKLRRQMPRWVTTQLDERVNVLPWLSFETRQHQYYGCDTLLLHDFLCDGLGVARSCSDADLVELYRAHVLPAQHEDATDPFLNDFDIPLFARKLKKPVQLWKIVQDGPHGIRGTAGFVEPVQYAAYVTHSCIGGDDFDHEHGHVTIIHDDPDQDMGDNSHFLAVVPLRGLSSLHAALSDEPAPEPTPVIPVQCSACISETCMGRVTASSVSAGWWCLSTVLDVSGDDAGLRFVCGNCLDTLDGPYSDRMIAEMPDYESLLRFQHPVVKPEAAIRTQSSLAVGNRDPPVMHPAGPLAGAEDAWFAPRFTMETLAALLEADQKLKLVSDVPTAPDREDVEMVQSPPSFLADAAISERDLRACIESIRQGPAGGTSAPRLTASARVGQRVDPTLVSETIPVWDARLSASLARLDLRIPASGGSLDDVSARMSEYPFVKPEVIPLTQMHTNNCVPASIEHVRCAPDELLARPLTQPYSRPAAEKRFIPTDECPMPFPCQLFADCDGDKSETWETIQEVSRIIAKELARLEEKLTTMTNPKPDDLRFNFALLEPYGGRDGLVIPEDLMAPAYADFHWSLEKHLNTGGKARCEPVYNDSVKPDDNCNLNLEKLWQIAVDMDYTDMQIVGELCKEGLRNRSHVDGRSVLQCNYAGFYHHMIFNATKRAEKLSFQPPRLLGPFSAPPFIPFRVVPKNVVVQISDDGNGNIKWKYRATSDYGAPRGDRNRTWDERSWVDWSVNGCINLLDSDEFPSFVWASVSRMARQAAIMSASGLKLSKFKSDFASFFETLPRAYADWFCQIQFVSSEGLEIDPRGIFGNREMPALSSRVSTFYVNIMKDRLQRLQLQWLKVWLKDAQAAATGQKRRLYKSDVEFVHQLRQAKEQYEVNIKVDRRYSPPQDYPAVDLAGDVPVETRQQFVQWLLFRQSLGQSGDMWCMDIFVDDSFGVVFEFAICAFETVYRSILPEYGVQLANGLEGTSDKTEIRPGAQDMLMLGLNVRLPAISIHGDSSDNASCGLLELPESKVSAYTVAGARIKQIAEANAGNVPTPMVEAFMGKMLFCCQACPSLKGDWMMLLHMFQQSARVRRGQAGITVVPASARFVIDTMLLKLVEENGVCLFPREGEAGADKVPVVWRFFDAALNAGTDGSPFVGFGGWQWVEGDDVIRYYAAPWTARERQLLEINALELINIILGEELFRPTTNFEADVIAACDNINAACYILNGAKCKAGPLRAIYRKRMRLVLEHEALQPGGYHLHRILGCHVLRAFNAESDALSRGLIADFMKMINKRFGRTMRFERIQVEGARLRQTSSVLRAAVADKAYKAAKEQEVARIAAGMRQQGADAGLQPSNVAAFAAQATALISKPSPCALAGAYHGTGFKFQIPEPGRPDLARVAMATAAHCIKKCPSCRNCSVCAVHGSQFRLVPSLPANGDLHAQYVDCDKCRKCVDCAAIVRQLRVNFTESGGKQAGQLRIRAGSVWRNNKLDLCIFELDDAAVYNSRHVLPLQILMEPTDNVVLALVMPHHRSLNLAHCLVATARISSSAASVNYTAMEPNGFGPGASGAPALLDNGSVVTVHYAGAAALSGLPGMQGRLIPGYGVLARLLIDSLVKAADAKPRS
jgi:hypothetical protein